MKVIDDEMLQRFARALNVPFDYLKTLEEDAPVSYTHLDVYKRQEHWFVF